MATKSLMPSLDVLSAVVSEEDSADISKFLNAEIFGASPDVELVAALDDFIQLRIAHWRRLKGETEGSVSSSDVHSALKRCLNAGARKDRVLGLATKLVRALERSGE